MEITFNGQPPYAYERCGLDTFAGGRVAVKLMDGTEVTGKLSGYWPSGFDLEVGAFKPRYFYFEQVASVRPAAA